MRTFSQKLKVGKIPCLHTGQTYAIQAANRRLWFSALIEIGPQVDSVAIRRFTLRLWQASGGVFPHPARTYELSGADVESVERIGGYDEPRWWDPTGEAAPLELLVHFKPDGPYVALGLRLGERPSLLLYPRPASPDRHPIYRFLKRGSAACFWAQNLQIPQPELIEEDLLPMRKTFAPNLDTPLRKLAEEEEERENRDIELRQRRDFEAGTSEVDDSPQGKSTWGGLHAKRNRGSAKSRRARPH